MEVTFNKTESLDIRKILLYNVVVSSSFAEEINNFRLKQKGFNRVIYFIYFYFITVFICFKIIIILFLYLFKKKMYQITFLWLYGNFDCPTYY